MSPMIHAREPNKNFFNLIILSHKSTASYFVKITKRQKATFG